MEAWCYWFETRVSSASGKTWNLWGKKKKGQNFLSFAFFFYPQCPSKSYNFKPSLAKPTAKPQLQPLLPVLEREHFSSGLCQWSQATWPHSPTQEMWLIFAQGVICWHDSHKQQTPLINMILEWPHCSLVLHPTAPTLSSLIWRASQKQKKTQILDKTLPEFRVVKKPSVNSVLTCPVKLFPSWGR